MCWLQRQGRLSDVDLFKMQVSLDLGDDHLLAKGEPGEDLVVVVAGKPQTDAAALGHLAADDEDLLGTGAG